MAAALTEWRTAARLRGAQDGGSQLHARHAGSIGKQEQQDRPRKAQRHRQAQYTSRPLSAQHGSEKAPQGGPAQPQTKRDSPRPALSIPTRNFFAPLLGTEGCELLAGDLPSRQSFSHTPQRAQQTKLPGVRTRRTVKGTRPLRAQTENGTGRDADQQRVTGPSRKNELQHDEATEVYEMPRPALCDRPEFCGASRALFGPPPQGSQLAYSTLWEHEREGTLETRMERALRGDLVSAASRTEPTSRRVVSRPGWHQAACSPPSLVSPGRGGRSNSRDEPGPGEVRDHRMRNSSLAAPAAPRETQPRGTTSPGTRASTPATASSQIASVPMKKQGKATVVVASPPLGASPPPGQTPAAAEGTSRLCHGESVRVLLRGHREQVALRVSQQDWLRIDPLGVESSPDLVVALCLRQHLGSTELLRFDLMSIDGIVLSRGVWPLSWEELVSFSATGGYFQTGSYLLGGMDLALQAQLDAIRFDDSIDWPLLQQCHESVRRQEQFPQNAPVEYRSLAECFMTVAPLQQWELLASVPELQGRCNATPERMIALGLVHARGRARTRPLPPCVESGASGQFIELRFNNVPPPPAPPTGGDSTEAVKDWALVRLELLAPELWTDQHFELSTARRSFHLEGNPTDLKVFSFTILLAFGPWIGAFLEGKLLLAPESYCTVAPSGTFAEVALAPQDHAVFRAIRRSLQLSSAESLLLLEEGLARALRGYVSARFTTSLRINNGGGGGKGKPSWLHFSPDDEGSSTLITMEPAPILLARRNSLHVLLPLGTDGQFPVTLKLQLPAYPSWALRRQIASVANPALRSRLVGTQFTSHNVLLGPLPSGWMTEKIDHCTSEEERVRIQFRTLTRGCLGAKDAHFVGRREKGDPNPLFLYLEFPDLVSAQAFGVLSDAKGLNPTFYAFWDLWFPGKAVPFWSCSLLLEAMEMVHTKAWKEAMERGTRSPCPPIDQGANVGLP